VTGTWDEVTPVVDPAVAVEAPVTEEVPMI